MKRNYQLDSDIGPAKGAPRQRPWRLFMPLVVMLLVCGLILTLDHALAGGPRRRSGVPPVVTGPPRTHVLLVEPPLPVPARPPAPGLDPRFVRPAPEGLDPRFAVEARRDLDPGILVPPARGSRRAVVAPPRP